MRKSKKRLRNILLSIAAILLMAAIGVMAAAIVFENNAAASRDEVLPVLETVIAQNVISYAEEEKGGEAYAGVGGSGEAETVTINGDGYIGILEIPCIGLTLPVLGEWSYPALRKAPCRYSGSVYENDMVICGHNLPVHFAALKDVPAGADVFFTDAYGRLFSYEVTGTDIVGQRELEVFYAGDWDMTLYTCKANRIERVAVRLKRR